MVITWSRLQRLTIWKEKHPSMLLKRLILLSGLASLCLGGASAQFVNGRFTTSFYTWDKFDTIGVSKTYLRAFQGVQLSVAQGDVSVHTYLQGAMNAVNSFGDVGRVRFYNLYLSWDNIGKMVDLDLGRQAVYGGVANGTIDGLRARAKFLDEKITVSGFGGATVNDNFTGVRKNMHDNYSFGGQVVTTALDGARIGVSYLNRRMERDPYVALRAHDTTFTPTLTLITFDPDAEQYGSVDGSYTYGERASFYGRYDYDFNMMQTSRGQGGVRVSATDALAFTLDYIYRAPHIAYNSIFSVFTSNATQEVEGGVEYGFSRLIRAFGRLALVDYSDVKSHRWSLGLNAGYGSFAYTGSDGYAGHIQSLSLQGGYPVLDKKVVPSLGVSYAWYRFSPDSRANVAVALLAGAVVRPTNTFSFDLQGQWMTNKILTHDLRLQARISYWFAERLSVLEQEAP